MLCNCFEILDYRKVLGTHALALTAFDALARLAVFFGKKLIIGEVDRPAFLSHVFTAVFIINGEILGYADIHRTAFGAVMACRAWNGDLTVDNVRNFKAEFFFFFGQRNEILHI